MGKLILIAAAGENDALGLKGDLPWHLPNDFKRFKKLTSGHKIIMGRKTFETFPRPLPNREHIVVTQDKKYRPKFEAQIFYSLVGALEYSKSDSVTYIIGGGEIYKQSMPYATHIELTRVHGYFEADTFFPKIDPKTWKLIAEEQHTKDERHGFAFTYQTYRRRGDFNPAVPTSLW